MGKKRRKFINLFHRKLNKKLITNQFSSVTQLHPPLCDTTNCSTQGFPVHHQHRELTQTHVQVSDAIQPSYPVIPFSFHLQSFPAVGSFPMSQFFTSSDQILELQLQHQSFQ